MTPTTHIRQVIAHRLRELMAARPDLDTQVKVARRAGLSQSTVARILSAEASATADSIGQLARAFGVPAASLLLSDPAEAALLTEMQRMQADARQRLLGFAAGMSSDQHLGSTPSRFSLDSSTPVPPSRKAAHAKAVARPIKDTTQESGHLHARKRPPR